MFEKRNFDNFDWTWILEDTFTWNWFITYSKVYKTTPYNWPEKLLEYCTTFNCIIQAGGNAGMYPKFYSKYFKEVHTFEPDDKWFYCLDKNITEKNVKKYNVFLGETNTRAKTEMNPKSPDNFGAIRTKIDNSPNSKEMITIDSLNLSPNMIHLDVEGFEHSVLNGATTTIKRNKPIIVLETQNHFKNYGTSLSEIEITLNDLGYIPIKRWKLDCVYAYNG